MKSGNDTMGVLGVGVSFVGFDRMREEEMRRRSMFLGRAEGPCGCG